MKVSKLLQQVNNEENPYQMNSSQLTGGEKVTQSSMHYQEQMNMPKQYNYEEDSQSALNLQEESKMQLINVLTQDLEAKQNELYELKELLLNQSSTDDPKILQKKLINNVSSLEDFLSLALDAIKVLQLDLANLKESQRQEQIESEKLRETFCQLDTEKEELLKGYELQLEECKRQLDEEEAIKHKFKSVICEREQEIDSLKEQLRSREFISVQAEEFKNSKQYLESLVFQNNHIQLELKKMNDNFKEMQSSVAQGIRAGGNQFDEKELRQFCTYMSNVFYDYGEAQIVKLIYKNIQTKDRSLQQIVKEKDYPFIISCLIKTLKEILKKFGCDVADDYQLNDEDLEVMSNSSFKNDLLNNKGSLNLDSQYQNYVHNLKASSLQIDQSKGPLREVTGQINEVSLEDRELAALLGQQQSKKGKQQDFVQKQKEKYMSKLYQPLNKHSIDCSGKKVSKSPSTLQKQKQPLSHQQVMNWKNDKAMPEEYFQVNRQKSGKLSTERKSVTIDENLNTEVELKDNQKKPSSMRNRGPQHVQVVNLQTKGNFPKRNNNFTNQPEVIKQVDNAHVQSESQLGLSERKEPGDYRKRDRINYDKTNFNQSVKKESSVEKRSIDLSTKKSPQRLNVKPSPNKTNFRH